MQIENGTNEKPKPKTHCDVISVISIIVAFCLISCDWRRRRENRNSWRNQENNNKLQHLNEILIQIRILILIQIQTLTLIDLEQWKENRVRDALITLLFLNPNLKIQLVMVCQERFRKVSLSLSLSISVLHFYWNLIWFSCEIVYG